MTISSENRKAGPFIGNGATTSFPFSFKVFQASDIWVVVADAAGVETTLTLGSGYTVALSADQDTSPGGSVMLATALATGSSLVVTSAVPGLQPVELTNGGGFYPKVINDALDRGAIQDQQLAERLARVVTFPITDASGANADLPTASVRKGAVLAFDDATGAPIVGPDIASVGTVAANVAAINTTAKHIDAIIDAPNQASAAAGSASSAAGSASASQAWAESTGAPGAAGTKSSKSWSTQSQAWAESDAAPGDAGTKSAKSWAADAKGFADQISGSAVLSVNGKTGNAVLSAYDVGAVSQPATATDLNTISLPAGTKQLFLAASTAIGVPPGTSYDWIAEHTQYDISNAVQVVRAVGAAVEYSRILVSGAGTWVKTLRASDFAVGTDISNHTAGKVLGADLIASPAELTAGASGKIMTPGAYIGASSFSGIMDNSNGNVNIVLPSGLIIKQFNYVLTIDGSVGSIYGITFPSAFPNSGRGCIVTNGDADASQQGINAVVKWISPTQVACNIIKTGAVGISGALRAHVTAWGN